MKTVKPTSGLHPTVGNDPVNRAIPVAADLRAAQILEVFARQRQFLLVKFEQERPTVRAVYADLHVDV